MVTQICKSWKGYNLLKRVKNQTKQNSKEHIYQELAY